MAAQHLRCASRQMKLTPADIDPHVGVRHHQIGIAGQPETGDIEQRRQPLVGDSDVDMLEMDRVAEILCGAVKLLHGYDPRVGGIYFDKFSSSRFSAVFANACMLACRSLLPVSSVNTDCAGPDTAMQLWPAASP